jgi:hypothetical protein
MADADDLSYIIEHVFLPPKLPQKDDSEYWKDFTLGRHCLDALVNFRDFVPAHGKWATCCKMVRNMLALRDPSEGMLLDGIGRSLAEMEMNGMA